VKFWGSAQVEGLIAHYGLVDWWLTTFDKAERIYMDNQYQALNFPQHSLTQGKISMPLPVSEFLNGLETWFNRKDDINIAEKIHSKVVELGYSDPITKPGYFNGRHYSTYVDDVKNLKRDGKFEEAEKLLLELIKATEQENNVEKLGVAPWYYEQLSIIYRKQKNYHKEVSILERFAKQKLPKHWGISQLPVTHPLIQRLEKAKILARMG